jgi:alpha-glucosidase
VRRRTVLATLLSLALPAGAPAAVDRTVSAGLLTATVTADPWSLTFADANGKTVLAEATGTASGPTGTVGFQTTLGWYHATKVIDEQRAGTAYIAHLATNDPSGRTLAIKLAPDAAGVIAFIATVQGSGPDAVQQAGIAFAAHPGERYLGFGERSNAVNQRGNDVEDYVSDGPYQPEERPVVGLLVPAPGFHPRDDATYFPVPWLLSSAGYGVLVGRDETSTFRLGTDDPNAWSTEVAGPTIALRVFAGPTPAIALERYTARLGRQPRVAAPFFFGPWWQPEGTDADNLATLAKADAPASLVQTYTHYLPCASQTGQAAQERERVAKFHAAGLADTTYFNPMICTSHPRYGAAVAANVLTKKADGSPYTYQYQGSTRFTVAQFDFSAPGANAFYASLLEEAYDAGYDGWMEDFGEYTPTDAVSADGEPGPAMHNRYVELYHRSARRFALSVKRPLARFNRSGWTGAQQWDQVVWGGDPTTDWGFDGLSSAVKQALTIGMSGVSMWGSDIGGYFSLGARHLTPELLMRWIEFGSASGVMRTEGSGFDIPDHGHRPQIFDPDVLPVWRRYAKLRTQLYPYLAAAEREYDRTGMPLMRDLALVAPNDPAAVARDDEYELGDALLVAPVLAPGATDRSLYLPAGRWVDLWRSATVAKNGSLVLGAPKVLPGTANATIPAPLAELPLLVRAGAVLPLLPADVDTLTGYGKAPGLVHLRDRAGTRQLLAFPRGRTRSALGPGETLFSKEGSGRWTLTVHATRPRTYRLQATLGTLDHPFMPCSIRVGRRSVTRRAWSYSATSTVLRARLRLRRRATAVVRACS